MISTRRSLWALVASVAAASVAFVAATAEPARAQAPVATLEGETFLACQGGVAGGSSVGCPAPGTIGTISVRSRCTSADTGTISWNATGEASGPYPGTFTEMGTAQFTNGQLTTLAVTFSIDSLSGHRVEGRKFILVPVPTGGCRAFFAAFESEVNAVVRYEATITPPTGGSYHDEGVVRLNVFGLSAQSPFVADVETTIGFLIEGPFDSDLLFARPLGCPDDDDEDSDGLTDHNESIFATLLGNADSDLDGIKDGNDDANGNGEDDEDEDDDEDDDCPDEDSDGDGEDDEDEDDDD